MFKKANVATVHHPLFSPMKAIESTIAQQLMGRAVPGNVRTATLDDTAYKWNSMSSAKKETSINGNIGVCKSDIVTSQSVGLNTAPWGTPLVTRAGLDREFSTRTLKDLSERTIMYMAGKSQIGKFKKDCCYPRRGISICRIQKDSIGVRSRLNPFLWQIPISLTGQLCWIVDARWCPAWTEGNRFQRFRSQFILDLMIRSNT